MDEFQLTINSTHTEPNLVVVSKVSVKNSLTHAETNFVFRVNTNIIEVSEDSTHVYYGGCNNSAVGVVGGGGVGGGGGAGGGFRFNIPQPQQNPFLFAPQPVVVVQQSNIKHYNDGGVKLYSFLLNYIEKTFEKLTPELKIQEVIQPVISFIVNDNGRVSEFLRNSGFEVSTPIFQAASDSTSVTTLRKRYFVVGGCGGGGGSGDSQGTASITISSTIPNINFRIVRE